MKFKLNEWHKMQVMQQGQSFQPGFYAEDAFIKKQD